MTAPLVLKFGGELIEAASDRANVAALAASVAARRPLVIVHGGGRAIDAELSRRQISPRKADGIRITDAATLDAVVAVLAGTTNTDLVASLVGAGVAAVGLTGADAGLGKATRVPPYRATDGSTVDLGLVGDPEAADTSLLSLLLRRGYVPVVASLGIDGTQVLNVNADVMACRIAEALPGCDLVIAGTTAGVLDASGRTIEAMDVAAIDEVIAGGTATAGMVAKLTACRTAISNGVASIRLVDGRGLNSEAGLRAAQGTRVERTGTSARPTYEERDAAGPMSGPNRMLA